MLATRHHTDIKHVRHITGYAVAGAAILSLTLAGCGGGGGSGSSGSGGKASSSGSATAAATLMTAKVDKAGTVVTDGKGYVLYRFDADSAKPTKVTCYNDCAKVWPAAIARGGITTKGVDKNLVSTVRRTDGTTQLTLAGHPLYRYAKDDQPREAYGQGVDGTWFALTPTGAKASTVTPTPSTGGNGY
jgi:predicted lipoprotein with Yx(FWY)xxD motif